MKNKKWKRKLNLEPGTVNQQTTNQEDGSVGLRRSARWIASELFWAANLESTGFEGKQTFKRLGEGRWERMMVDGIEVDDAKSL